MSAPHHDQNKRMGQILADAQEALSNTRAGADLLGPSRADLIDLLALALPYVEEAASDPAQSKCWKAPPPSTRTSGPRSSPACNKSPPPAMGRRINPTIRRKPSEMASLNKVTLIGRLGRDPEVRSFQNGGKIVNLRVATSESWRDKQTGERKERTEWHSVSISAEHAARYAEQYLRKGSLVYIEGQLETRKWQAQDGTDRYSTEIAVRQYGGQLQGLDGRQDGEGGGRGRDDDDRRGGGSSGGSGYGGGGRPSGGGGASRNDLDDEIPFAMEWRG